MIALPLVSIIMPLYNAEKYVAEAIESVINQTYKNWELIIVNDGSTDNSLVVAKKFESEKIKIYSQVNSGASAARNHGLSMAKGEYIQFLDADDLISENKIEEQISMLNGCTDKVAVCNCVHFFDGTDSVKDGIYIDESKFIFTTNQPIEFLINLYGGDGNAWMVQPNSWLTPIILIKKAGLWNQELSLDDDGEFFCRVLLKSNGVLYTPNAYNYYRKYNTNLSLASRKDFKAMESILKSIELKYNYLSSISSDLKINHAFAMQFFRMAVLSYPKFKEVSQICLEKVALLGGTKHSPTIGGDFIELIKKVFGWKAAKWISYNLGNSKHKLLKN